MKIDAAVSYAITGIQRGLDGAREHAGQIASAEQFSNGGPAGLVDPLLGLTQDRLQVSASVEVMKAVDSMIGSL